MPLPEGESLLCPDEDAPGCFRRARPGESGLLLLRHDARGTWLFRRRTDTPAVHVNGRPLHRLARLHPGDSVHCEGVDMLLGLPVSRKATRLPQPDAGSMRLPWPVLRGLCGADHGRAIVLDAECTVGGTGAAIQPDGHDRPLARVFVAEGKVWLDAGTPCRVNAEPLSQAQLQAGDQLVFAPGCRYLLELPGAATASLPAEADAGAWDAEDAPEDAPSAARGWLLMLAVASALGLALAALLWFGVK